MVREDAGCEQARHATADHNGMGGAWGALVKWPHGDCPRGDFHVETH
jgi:hypothetical protein